MESSARAVSDKEQEKLLPLKRCQVVPLPGRQFGFCIDGVEKTRWHAAHDAPRPFFYPINGPSGQSLTRMGHPGAPNHDHHRSLWFAHHDLLGIDFWSERTTAVIEQTKWYSIIDGDDSATAAFELVWKDGHDPTPLLRQDVFVTIRPTGDRSRGSWTLELQADFHADADGVEFRESNFGIIGMRVAKSLSVVFGSGEITGTDGRTGEKELFGKASRWIDYSGPIGRTMEGQDLVEGLTLIDHAENPGHQRGSYASWHVRDDGWIGPSLTRHGSIEVVPGKSLRCRYLLYVHPGGCNPARANDLATEFDRSRPLTLTRSKKQHRQYEVSRA